jgi:hypothetical protein
MSYKICPKCDCKLPYDRDMCSCGWKVTTNTIYIQKGFDPWLGLGVEAKEALYVRKMCKEFGNDFAARYTAAKEFFKNCIAKEEYWEAFKKSIDTSNGRKIYDKTYS